MAKRENFKDVEVQGKKWRIGRMDALTGSWVATSILLQVLPFSLGNKIPGVATEGKMMDKEIFMDIQKECLKVISEIQMIDNIPAPIPIMMEDGRWSSKEVQNNISLALSLTLQALIFNVSDFFEGNTLDDLNLKQMMPFQNLNHTNVKK